MNENNILGILNREGVMVSTYFSFWKGTVKLEPRDLGIDSEDIDTKVFSLGHKKIMGPHIGRINEFKVLGNRFSSIITNNSFNFLDKLRFIPNAKLQETCDQLDTVIQEATIMRDRFLDDYTQLKDDAIADWITFAETAEVKRNGIYELMFQREHIPMFVAKITDSFPSVLRLAKAFKFSYNLVAVKLPDQAEQQLTSLRDQMGIQSARNKLIQEESRKMAQESTAFLHQCLGEMRGGLVQIVTEVNKTLTEGKTVSQSTLNKLRNYFQQVRQMNFANDYQLTKIIDDFESNFLGVTANEYRDSEAALSALRGGMTTLVSQARDLANQETNQIISEFGAVRSRKIAM